MKYLSLFSGIGGFELGIQQAYENNKNRKRKPTSDKPGGNSVQRQRNIHDCKRRNARLQHGICVGFAEIDKYATFIYKKHFPDHKNYGDVSKIKTEELPDFDLLVGGFPCQAFSIAGKREGFEDPRGKIFFEIERILRAKKPRVLLLENVKGLLSHNDGKTFKTIVATLDELRYDVQWQVLNSKNFDVPQNRERIFIVGHLRETSRPEVFPIGNSCAKNFVLPTLTARYYGAQANGGYIYYPPNKKKRRVKIAEATKQGFVYAEEGDSIAFTHPGSTTRRGRVNKYYSHTVVTSCDQGTLEKMRLRRLTPTECERLQGFPDGWTEGVSDTQRYKCLGNAVTVNVIREIISLIISSE